MTIQHIYQKTEFLFNKDKSILIRYPVNKDSESYVIPDGVITIESNAFADCKTIQSVIMPDSVSTIEYGLFENCSYLKDVTLSKNITAIPAYVFMGCSNLTSITLSNSVKRIGERAFNNCNRLKEIYFWGNERDWNEIDIDNGVGGNHPFVNATVYYNKQCIVNFNLNGGEGLCPKQEVLVGNFFSVPEAPKKEGYVFTGWYANEKCTGQPYISSAGIIKRTIVEDITLYAGWKSTDAIEWGKDTFKFGNINYFWGNNYSISDEYYNILTKDLGAYDKYCMWIQKNRDFGGSCYGMSVAMAMFEQGLMTPHFVWSGAENVHDLPYPKDDMRVASLLNYYQLSQSLPSINKKLNNQSKMGTKYLAKELVNALWDVKNTGVPVVIGYEFKDGRKWYKHAVLAYKVEEDGLYYKVHIADPNNLAHSDPTASSFVIVEDTEPSYMYIDNDWSSISYKGAEGTHSFADNTFKLFCVLDDNSLYQSINIQEKLTNQCMGISNYSLMLASLDETTAVSHLSVNFDEFSIGNGLENTTISKDGINGDLEISDGTSNYGDNYVSYDLQYSEQYTVTPSVELDDGYESTIIFKGDYATFMSAKSEKIATFDFSNNGMLKILSDVKCNKTISYSTQNNEWLLGGIEISANVNSLELEVLEEGRYHIKSSSSLKDAVVSIIDLDGNKTSVVVSDDVLEFIFTYSQSEQQYVISFEGTNNDEQITKSSTVVFYSNGGSSIESISDIEYGDKIMKPESPIYEGFIFDGWYVDETFTVEWNFETDIVTDNMILYAKWKEDSSYYHLVTFDDDGVISQMVVKNGDTITIEEYPELTNKENLYSAWEKVDTTNVSADLVIHSINVAENATVKAILESISFEENEIIFELSFEYCLVDCIAYVEVLDYFDKNIEQSYQINIDKNTNSKEIILPYKADDYEHFLQISFFKDNTKESSCGNSLETEFYAERTRYTEGDYVYTITDGTAEILEYIGTEQSIIIPEKLNDYTVTQISSYSFSDSTIESVTIPACIETVQNSVFAYCYQLNEINVSTNNSYYTAVDGVLYNKNKTSLMQYPVGKENTAFEIPEGVTTICEAAFLGCQASTVVLPKSLTLIDYRAFYNCENLKIVLYYGSQEDWQNVEVEYRNDDLMYADFIYNYDENASVNASISSCYYDEGKVVANIKYNYIFEDCTALFAIYNEDGRMVAMDSKPITKSDTDTTFTIEVKENCKGMGVKTFFWDSLETIKPIGNVAYGVVGDLVLESTHPYENNIDETKVYTYSGDCTSIDVTFSDDTETESGWDYIYIYDANDNQIGRYSGTELAGQTIRVPGNTVKIRLTSDDSGTRNGYRTESIVVNK